MPFTGTYTVDTDGLGRGVITLTAHQSPKPFYLVSPGKGFIISTGSSAESGVFEPQTGGPFSNTSLSGNHALGTTPAPMSFFQNGIWGTLTPNGVGSLSGSSAAASLTFTGTYSIAANGRAPLAITPSAGLPPNIIFYLVSPAKAVGIQADAGAANVAVAIIEK
jgi:hypothetical protein